MGDAVFAPIYLVLKQRGVKFRFFHQVQSISLNTRNKTEVDTVNISRQVDTLDTEYYPLVHVKGLASWPSQPNFNQIVPEQARLLLNNNINLGNFWSNWSQVYYGHFKKRLPVIQLRKGQDFDKIVYGMSVKSLGNICQELLVVSPTLRAAHENVKTTATQAFQIWTDQSLESLGWEDKVPPLAIGLGEPFDTYAAMNQVLPREDWAQIGLEPKNIAYFCSALHIPPEEYPARNDADFPSRMAELVKANAKQRLAHLKEVWPFATEHGHFNWTMLTAPNKFRGEQRFDAQYWRANIDPSEQYVLAVVNTSQHRIRTDGAGFTNILFTGDWIKVNIAVGCVEAAANAGLQTAKVLSHN